MLLKRKKQAEEVIEVPLPAFFRDELGHFSWCINENEDIVAISFNQITIWKKGTPAYEITLREVAAGNHITHSDFSQVFNMAMSAIEAATAYAFTV